MKTNNLNERKWVVIKNNFGQTNLRQGFALKDVLDENFEWAFGASAPEPMRKKSTNQMEKDEK